METYVKQFETSEIIFGEQTKHLYEGMKPRDHFMNLIGVKVFYFSKELIFAKIPVTNQLSQPMGIIHGGVSASIAEGLGSMGSSIYALERKKGIVGLQVTTNHVTKVSVSENANLIAEARPLDIQGDIQVWEIIIKHEKTLKIISISKLTCILLNLNSKL